MKGAENKKEDEGSEGRGKKWRGKIKT